MKISELVTPYDIILVMGKLCSGKGYFCSKTYPDHYHLPVSTVVKQLARTSVRSELANTSYMDQNITQELIRQIDKHRKIVIDGIRQLSIVQSLQQHYGNKIKDIIWLDVPEKERASRFAARADKKDDVTFDVASRGDRELGIDDVEQYVTRVGRVVPN